MKIYLASPLFTEEELSVIGKVENILRSKGHIVFSPREHENREFEVGTRAWSMQIFNLDRSYIDWCDCMVMIYYGGYSDSGTAWECGYAYGTNKPVIVVQMGKDSNLMVHEGCHTNVTLEELETFDFDMMPKKGYVGNMF